MTTTETAVRNGVDTATLFATLDAVKAAPEAAKFQFRASNRWVSGTHSQSTIHGFFGVGEERSHEQSHTYDVDHPKVLVGADMAPTPVEFLLHALAGCLTAGLANIAAARGVELTEVTSTVEGDIDLNGILGLDPEVRNGFSGDPRVLRREGQRPGREAARRSSSSRGPAPPCSTSSRTACPSRSRSTPADPLSVRWPAPPWPPDRTGHLEPHPCTRATSTPTRARPDRVASADLAVGARAMAPWLAGIVPFGLVIGVATAEADFPAFAGWLTGPLIYAGSAQVAVIDLLDAGATPALVIVAALAVNLRLVLYSATMAKHWEGTPRWWRALAAYLVVDPSVAVGVDLYETATDRRRAHVQYMGAACLLWFAWIGAITVGATAGARLPAALHFELVIPLFLAGAVAVRVSDERGPHGGDDRGSRGRRRRAGAAAPLPSHRHRRRPRRRVTRHPRANGQPDERLGRRRPRRRAHLPAARQHGGRHGALPPPRRRRPHRALRRAGRLRRPRRIGARPVHERSGPGRPAGAGRRRRRHGRRPPHRQRPGRAARRATRDVGAVGPAVVIRGLQPISTSPPSSPTPAVRTCYP